MEDALFIFARNNTITEGGLKAVHSHPFPVRSKLGSKLEQTIAEAVKIDPSNSSKDTSKGAIYRHHATQYFGSLGQKKLLKTKKRPNKFGKRILHIADFPHMMNRSTTQFFPTRMLELLNEARVMEADVTFPGAKSFSYVLNMVSFNYETLNHQVVARVLMTRLAVSAYKTVFGKVLVSKNSFNAMG
uniref:Uncharacterized protein n=1 Tax=Daphnia galeata TaxID=27404 RepID=A0A8J2RRE8_9CRUS|nr:unnamed protein product [Daphnia galeata]